MATSLNKVLLIGNVGADPEYRVTANGNSVINLRLATNENYKNKNGEWVENVEWHTVVAWGELADRINTYTQKGTKLYVEGSNQTRSWEDQNGIKKYTTEIKARHFLVLGGGKEKATNTAATAYATVEDGETDDDLPF